MAARPRFLAGLMFAAMMVFVACSGDAGTAASSSTPAQPTEASSVPDTCDSPAGGTGSAVTATELARSFEPQGFRPIKLDTTSVTAGPTTFTVTNEGPGGHQFLVLKTDLAPNHLPLTDDGSKADVKAPSIDLIGKIDLINAGCAASLTLDLQKGNYVMICNLVGFPGSEGHYEAGMVAPPFTAT